MKVKFFLAGFALVAVTALASAQNPVAGRGNSNGTSKSAAFVDANKNGICDTYENRASQTSVGKRNGTGNCVGQGNRKGNNSGKRQGPGNGSCRRLQ